MSMPSFPKDGANMSREQALTMVVASIAMEENALGRVIDAEGDKLRYILDRCREESGCEETPKEILEANESVTRLLEAVAQNQTILRNKLALALDACGGCPPEPPCPPPCPPAPPCPPTPCPPVPPYPPTPCPPVPPCPPTPCPEKSLMQLRLSGDGFLWQTGCPIPWEYRGGLGNAVRWRMENPSQVELDPSRAWSVSCTFLVRDFQPGLASGCIRLEADGASHEPPLCFSIRCACGEAVTLPYSTLLLPDSACAAAFRLCSKCPLWVEQAELNIVEL